MARELMMVKVDVIDDSVYRMRGVYDPDQLGALVNSIKRDGLLSPLLVARKGEGFVLVAGHRRLKACSIVGLVEVPCQVLDRCEALGWRGAWSENLCRHDLSPIEEGAALKDGLDSCKSSVVELADIAGRSEDWVRGRLLMLEWPGNLQEAVHYKALSVGAASNLALIKDATQRDMLIGYAVENGATARITAAWLQAADAGGVQGDPGEVVPEAGKAPVVPLEPHHPCVVCSKMLRMVELSYLPLCRNCSEAVIAAARAQGSVGDGRTPA